MTLVSVVVPSLNAERTIQACMESISRQTFPELEVIVVDAKSTDDTRRVASEFGKVIVQECGITLARLIGARAAAGQYVLNLDADQVLKPNAIRDAVATGKPIVAFGETGVGTSFVARVNGLDKSLTNRYWTENMDPVSGSVRPRFYDRQLLIDALESIPKRFIEIRPCPYSEDSLIYIEAYRRRPEVDFVPDGIVHFEEERLLVYLRKWAAYGRTAKAYRGTSYESLIWQRGKRRGNGTDLVGMVPGLAIRILPFFCGFFF